MARELLYNMLKEEWRIHTVLLGGVFFLVFPLSLLLIFLLLALFAPYLRSFASGADLLFVLHMLLIFFGVNVGAFGLYGKEFMNRRFGHSSLLAYTSRTLPLSEHRIYLSFIIKDVLYYLFMFVLPISIGVGASAMLTGLAPASPAWLLTLVGSLILSFLMGLSVTFFLSTLYTISNMLLFGFVGLLTTGIVAVSLYSATSFHLYYPPLLFQLETELKHLFISLLIILVFFVTALRYARFDFYEPVKHYSEKIDTFTRLLRPSSYAPLIAKDIIDVLRSRGGVGRIFFSLCIPVVIIWYFITMFVRIVPLLDFMVLFSLFLGIYTPSIYNWLTSSDAFAEYAHLPLRISHIIKSKLLATMVLALSSVGIFIVALIIKTPPLEVILPAFVMLCSLSIYGLTVTIYLTGLSPNIRFFHTKNLVLYIVLIVTPALVVLFLSLLSPLFMAVSVLLLLPAYFLLREGFFRWDHFGEEWNQIQ